MDANVRDDGGAPTNANGGAPVDVMQPDASVELGDDAGVAEPEVGAITDASAVKPSPTYAQAAAANAPLPPPQLPSADSASLDPLNAAPVEPGLAPVPALDEAEPSHPKRLHFDLGDPADASPALPSSPTFTTAPLSRAPSRPGLPSRQSSTFTAPAWHATPPRRPSKPSPTRPAAPKKTLAQTSADLRGLIRVFTVFFPASLRSLRRLLPAPLLRLARLLTNRVAMALHKRGALASSLFYDVVSTFC